MLFCENFDIVQLSVNPGLTRGVLVILAERGTLSAPVSEWVVPRHFRYSYALWRENIIFRFFEFGTQIEGGQNTISTRSLTQTLLILSV